MSRERSCTPSTRWRASRLQRIFYELYRDKAAFDAHEGQPHTRRYLAERDQYLAGTEVDWLTLQTGKGTDG